MKINALWDLWLGKKEPSNQKTKRLQDDCRDITMVCVLSDLPVT